MPRTKVPGQIVLESSSGSFGAEESQKRKMKKSPSSMKRTTSKDERMTSRDDDLTSSPRGSSRHASTAEKREKERRIRNETKHSSMDKEKKHKKKSRTRSRPVPDDSDSEADFLLDALLESDGEGLIQANSKSRTNTSSKHRHSAYDDDSSMEVVNGGDRYEKVVHSSDEPGDEDGDDDSMVPVKNGTVVDANPFEEASEESSAPPTPKSYKSRNSADRAKKSPQQSNPFEDETSVPHTPRSHQSSRGKKRVKKSPGKANPFDDEEVAYVITTPKREKSRSSPGRVQKQQDNGRPTKKHGPPKRTNSDDSKYFDEEDYKNPFGGNMTGSEGEALEGEAGANLFGDSSVELPDEKTNPFEDFYDDAPTEKPTRLSKDEPQESHRDAKKINVVSVNNSNPFDDDEAGAAPSPKTNPFESDSKADAKKPNQEAEDEDAPVFAWIREKSTPKKGFGWGKKPKLPFLGNLLKRSKELKATDGKHHFMADSWANPFADVNVPDPATKDDDAPEEGKRQSVTTSSTEEGVEASIDNGSRKGRGIQRTPTDDTKETTEASAEREDSVSNMTGEDDEEEIATEDDADEEEDEEDVIESSKRLLKMADQRMQYQKDHDEINKLRSQLEEMREQAYALTEQLRRSIETKCDLVLAQTEMERYHEQCMLLKTDEIKDLRQFNVDLMEKSSNLEARMMNEVGGLTTKINDMDRRHRNMVLEKDCEIAQLEQQVARLKTDSVRGSPSRTTFKNRFQNFREQEEVDSTVPARVAFA
jgi:hypothetical protein